MRSPSTLPLEPVGHWLPCIMMGLMLAGTSCQPGELRSLVIVGSSESADYGTIQEALDRAPPRAIVAIEPGVYREAVRITRPVTLRAKEKGGVTIVTDADDVEPPAAAEVEALIDSAAAATTRLERDLYRWELVKLRAADPALAIVGVEEGTVRLDWLTISMHGKKEPGSYSSAAAVRISDSNVVMRDCVFAGSPGNCVAIDGESSVELADSLVCGAWGTGVEIFQLEEGEGRVRVRDSEIRNCRHRGITVSGGAPRTSIERCRISGSSWHGLRYDSSAPRILGNLFFRNVRSDIYASGRSAARVEGNMFRSTGIACRKVNRDLIQHNTFVSSLSHDGAISVCEQSDPRIENNVFCGYGRAIEITRGRDAIEGTPYARTQVRARDNLFWETELPISWPRTWEDWVEVPLSAEAGNEIAAPGFRDPEHYDYGWRKGAYAVEKLAGAPSPLSMPPEIRFEDLLAGELSVVRQRNLERQ